jgi:predicted ATP-dependent endonuclease of OLD family
MLKKIIISNYRSISNLKVDFSGNNYKIICGANNVGKTNILRAIKLFFSLDISNFNAIEDIPHHIYFGKRGGGFRTKITSEFEDKKQNKYIITTTYKEPQKGNKILIIEGTKKTITKQVIKLSEKECKNFLNKYRFILVESNSIDTSKEIANFVSNELLIPLDSLRKRKTKPMEYLDKFISESEKALKEIKKELTENIKKYTKDINGIDNSLWKAEILFPEYINLRDALSHLIDFTLIDSNSNKIETKGSGIQRIVLYSVIEYISEQMSQEVIWGFDEPEAFLQPSLQKRVNEILFNLSKKYQTILNTHSPNFIKLENIKDIILLEADIKLKEYIRKKGEKFYEVNTKINQEKGVTKINLIKEHLGITKNDAWEILPYNILVEGQEDKDYLNSLFDFFNLAKPNILVAGGVDKYKGFLQFLELFCEELSFKPKILALFDFDTAGKNQYENIKNKKYDCFDIECKYIRRFDGYSNNTACFEIEDFFDPSIIMEIINKFLSEKKPSYTQLNSTDINERTNNAYNNVEILNFITTKITNKNSDKNVINFCDEGIKKYLSKILCEKIIKKECSFTDDSRTFIIQLLGENK